MIALAAAAGAGIGAAAAAFRASLVPDAEFSVTAAISTGDFSRPGLVGLLGIRLIALAAGPSPSAVTLRAGLVELALSRAASAGHLPLVIAMTAADEIFPEGRVVLSVGLQEETCENSRKAKQEKRGVSHLHRENR